MKKITSFILIILSFMFFPNISKALELGANDLMIFKDYAIKNTTTIEEINNKFGQPKITTSSAFGGKAYSYFDSDYTYYLFFETDAAGKIKSYGAIGGNFKMSRYKEGNTVNNTYGYMTGSSITEVFDTKYTFGALQYNVTRDEVKNYWSTYASDAKYLYDLQAHGLAAVKVMAVKDGYAGKIVQSIISEDLFYKNEQLKKNNSDFNDYSSKNGKTNYIKLITGRTTNLGNAEVPNPILFAGSIRKQFEAADFKYLFFDMKLTDASAGEFGEYFYFINPDFIREKNSVALTNDEITKLNNVNEQYKKYQDIIQTNGGNFSDADLYLELPQYSSLPLVAGVYKPVALNLATSYLNMARVGIGLRPLELDLDIANSAQHKAVLSYYNNHHGLDGGHNATKPAGLSDDFYNTAMKYGSENLFMGDILSSIGYALNDAYGDAINCGHRYNLLDPTYTKWGIGSVGTGLSMSRQSAHKFSGYSTSNTELVAWPSNGVFVTSILSGGIGNWTAKFYKNYEGTSNTTVTVENLTTGKTYNITGTSTDKFLKVNGKLITFRDDNIVYENGDVFKITLHNVKNLNNNNVSDYSYRSIFYSVLINDNTAISSLNVDSDNITLKVGEVKQISVSIEPSNASNKLMNFKSDNSTIAEVRQDGLVKAVKPGVTTITIECGNITKTVTVTVKNSDGSIPSYLRGDLNLNGVVEVADTIEALKYYVELIKLNDTALMIGDFNSNKKIDVSDAVEILKLYVNQ